MPRTGFGQQFLKRHSRLFGEPVAQRHHSDQTVSPVGRDVDAVEIEFVCGGEYPEVRFAARDLLNDLGVLGLAHGQVDEWVFTGVLAQLSRQERNDDRSGGDDRQVPLHVFGQRRYL